MLSLWKLRVGAEAYYLSQVARGIDDYYSGAGETAGRWFGTAADILNLPEAVDGDDLRAILAGLVPGTGLSPNGTQIRPFKNRVPGFDLTFSAPKSVSVMYAFADPIVRAKITAAVDTAVEDALSWLEREACFVRRGSNNRRARVAPFEQWGTRRLTGAGFIAAGFRHRTSRASDPQLHTHVLIANLTRGPDGRWTALDGQALYREAAYVSLSRARRSAHLYATTSDAATVGEPGHTTGIPLASENVDDPETDLTTIIAFSRAKQFVTAEHPELDRIADLATTHDLAELADRLHHVRTVIAEVTETGLNDPTQAIEELQLAEHQRRRMAVGGRVNARDWDNVGVVERLHDTTGQATVRFTSDTGQTRTRRLPWHLLKPIDHPEEVELTDLAAVHLAERFDEIETAQVKWIVELAELGVAPDEVPILHAAIAQRQEQLARSFRATPPDWLTTWVGKRPTDATAATVYDDLVAHLAHWRDQHRVSREVPGFGPRPEDAALTDEWDVANEHALAGRCYLLDQQTAEATVVATLDPAAIRTRLEELDALLDTAPVDQRHIVTRLVAQTGDGLTDTVEALRTAAESQEFRRDWILEHWPHIVEHHELTDLDSQYRSLASWPNAPSAADVNDASARPTTENHVEDRDVSDELDDARSILSRWRSNPPLRSSVPHVQPSISD